MTKDLFQNGHSYVDSGLKHLTETMAISLWMNNLYLPRPQKVPKDIVQSYMSLYTCTSHMHKSTTNKSNKTVDLNLQRHQIKNNYWSRMWWHTSVIPVIDRRIASARPLQFLKALSQKNKRAGDIAQL